MPTIGITLFLGLFFAVGFGILGYGLYSLKMSRVAKDWPTAVGKISESELKVSSDSESTTYQAKVKYDYQVDGVRYTGDRIAFGYAGSSGRASHEQIADKLKKAATVSVRYNPAEPSKSVLAYGINRSTVFMLIFGTTWLLFISGFAAMMLTTSKSDQSVLNTIEIAP